MARSILSPVKRFRTSASPPFLPIAVHHQTAGHRARRSPRGRTSSIALRVPRGHDDEQKIGDAGQRQERRIEEGDEEQPRRTERQRERADAADDSPHRMSW